MDPVLARAVETLLGTPLREVSPVSGGDIGECSRLTLADGERLFAKRYPDPVRTAAACEATGLAWLREATALGVPEILGVDVETGLLLLEWIEPADVNLRVAHDDAALGRGLATLHESGAKGFGFDEDNFIGTLPQANAARETWPEFYGEMRIAPLVKRARDAGEIGRGDARLADRLVDHLPERCGPPEPPARLHGDLWSGNVLFDSSGRPWLIDPAAYAGHREIDLAMMRLFGGFSDVAFRAYAEVMPLAADSEERVPLYQLYPLLVHTCLFGGHYADRVRSVLRRFA